MNIQKEIELLKDKNIPVFHDNFDIVVCLRSIMNQIINCFATTNQQNTVKLLLRMMAHSQYYFNYYKMATIVKRRKTRSLGEAILFADQAIKRAEEAIVREGRGDAKSHIMTLQGILLGAIEQFEKES